MRHSKSLMFSLTVFIWCWRWVFDPNLLAQILHSKSLIFWWTVFIWCWMWEFNPNFLAQTLQPKFLAFLLTSFKCHWRLSFRQNFLLLVLHSKAFALTKLKPDASFLADGGAKGNSLRNVAIPSPPCPPPAIQPRILGIQRMINTQSGLKRNNYAFYFFKNPNRQFSSCQPRSSDCVLVQNPAQRGMSQRKRNQRIGKK